jgi:alkanesulfonate monooxygenase SsuD/methylene tetrahydromethanopterin reductase-like flavin-dependent oxidoreductase (luciferase family)
MAMSILRFDMRAPGKGRAEIQRLYAAALEMAEYADGNGFDVCVVSEHHGSPDNYLSSPVVLASAIAARTSKVMISVQALLVPQHDPVRLAEDLAIADHVSKGRVTFTTGLGYRPIEYHMTGKDWSRRGKLLDEAIETMLKAWTGEPFEYRGEMVQVTPPPFSDPHPMFFVGGSGKKAVERAARYGLSASLAAHDAELEKHYYAECERLGTTPGMCIMPAEKTTGCLFISEDPERTWAEVGPAMLHDATVYKSWQTPDIRSAVSTNAETVEDLRKGHIYKVLTPDEAVALAQEQGPFAGMVLMPMVGGTSPELGWPSLELYVDKVLPRLKATA